MMKALMVAACLAMAGCATSRDFTNRLAPTIAGDKVLVVSWWKWFGIATEIDPADAAELEKLKRQAGVASVLPGPVGK